jgi:Mg-chelatase subunit ChlD
VLDTALVAGAVVAGALSTGWPENILQWTLLAVAAGLGGLAPHSPISDLLRAGVRRLLRGTRAAGLRRLLVGTVAVLAAAGAGRSIVVLGPDAMDWASARVVGCADPTELRLLAAPEGLAAARELARRFEHDETARRHGCAAVNLYVYAQPSAAARNALAGGWSTNHLRTLGPRPDLWLPGSTRYALVEPRITSNGLLPGARTVPVASTPIVLAVPAAAVPDRLADQRTELTWAEALAAAKAQGWDLARPDPARSVTGELATVAMYTSGGGLAGDAPSAALADTAREIERRVADGLDAHGYPLADEVGVLCAHRQLGLPRTALVVTEQQLVRFNAGHPLGGGCPGRVAPLFSRAGLFALYPADTLSLDYPLIRLDWPRRSAAQREWTDRFAAWLQRDAGKQALNDAGLRPPGRPVGDPLSEGMGALPGVPLPSPVRPAEAVLRQVHRVRAAAQRPGRVLLAVDASGSMTATAGPDGRSRFAVASTGVTQSLSMMTGRDEFGLWTFQGAGPNRQLMAIGPGTAPRRDAAVRALRAVRPSGDTPLYRVIVDGVTALRPADPNRVNALVVLTDGEDRGSDVSRAATLAAVRNAGVRVFVVAVGEADCGARTLREITRRTGGDCVQAGFGTLDRRMAELFQVLWGGT